MNTTENDDKPEQAGAYQNIARAVLALSALADASEDGLRFTDVVGATGLSKVTTHRLLAGLVEHGLAEQNEETGRFFLGMRLYGWAIAAGDRFGIMRIVAPSLDRLVHETEDTIYLMMRSGFDAICLERREGSYPIKTLTLKAGDRRPLGIGAASLALLAFLPAQEIDRIITARAEELGKFGISLTALRRMIKSAQKEGHARYDGQIIRNMSAIGVPLLDAGGRPIASLSIAAISERMSPERSKTISGLLREEADRFHAHYAAGVSGNR